MEKSRDMEDNQYAEFFVEENWNGMARAKMA
jgi:hypothetical protein